MKANEIRPGMALNIEGNIWLVVKIDHVKPGKGPAFIQTKLKNLQTGANNEKRFRSAEDVDGVNLDRRDIEYLYSDNTGAVFMDMESYEQSTVPADVLGDALLYTKPNQQITGLVYNGNVMSVELPAAVDLEITDTPPGVKNATVTNVMKEATCETGLKTRVPDFINQGEMIRVSTVTGEYMSRVKD
ncbi:elongation factor P [Poriferisphaera sp. WC338]|uniref:elongation factor P n=1 Tax=Poriferisphaera sp. WC338 TaxID=3425129 RepID=UPI003D8188AB